eukprot:7416182-Pyramimonas_sp.AAC.1
MKLRVEMAKSDALERVGEIKEESALIQNVLRRHKADLEVATKRRPAEKMWRARENSNFSEMHGLR